MRAYSAGILFYSVDPGGDTQFYLGRERMCPWKTALTWADFGGRAEREDDGEHEVTAAREAYEESLGVFGTLAELVNRLRTRRYTMKITMAKHNRFTRFRVLYCLEVPHGEDYGAEFLRRRHLLLGVQVMVNTARARLFGIQVKGGLIPGSTLPGDGVVEKIQAVSHGRVTFELQGGGRIARSCESREIANRYADVHTMQTLIVSSIDALPPSLSKAVLDWSDPYLPGVRDYFMEKDRLASVVMKEVMALLIAIRKTSSNPDHPLRASFAPLLRIFITQLTLAEDGSWRL